MMCSVHAIAKEWAPLPAVQHLAKLHLSAALANCKCPLIIRKCDRLFVAIQHEVVTQNLRQRMALKLDKQEVHPVYDDRVQDCKIARSGYRIHVCTCIYTVLCIYIYNKFEICIYIYTHTWYVYRYIICMCMNKNWNIVLYVFQVEAIDCLENALGVLLESTEVIRTQRAA